MSKQEEFEKCLKDQNYEKVISLVRAPADYNKGEAMVYAVLADKGCPQNVLDATLEGFITTDLKYRGAHGYWVHSLSHFTGKLWVRGLKTWVTRLNGVAFAGANKLGDSNCCNRLLGDFMNCAPWDAIPEEYGYTEENLRWAKVEPQCEGDVFRSPEEGEAAVKALKLFPFPSKEEWKKCGTVGRVVKRKEKEVCP